MSSQQSAVDIIRDVVEAMVVNIIIKDVDDSVQGFYVLTVCDLYYLLPGRVVTIDGNQYTIIQVDDLNDSVTLSGTEPIAAEYFTIAAPYFFYGSIIDMDKKVQEIPASTDKTPMIFMLLEYRQIFYPDEDARERDLRCVLYFLTESNFAGWDNDNIMEKAVKPMERLRRRFVDELKTRSDLFYTEQFTYDAIPKLRFGVYASASGVKKAFTAMDLSGEQMDCTITIRRQQGPCCDIPDTLYNPRPR